MLIPYTFILWQTDNPEMQPKLGKKQQTANYKLLQSKERKKEEKEQAKKGIKKLDWKLGLVRRQKLTLNRLKKR